MTPHRIPNDTHIEFTEEDWIGVVVDQSGDTVVVTFRGETENTHVFLNVPRDKIVKDGRTYKVRGFIAIQDPLIISPDPDSTGCGVVLPADHPKNWTNQDQVCTSHDTFSDHSTGHGGFGWPEEVHA